MEAFRYCLLENHLHRLVIIPLNFDVRDFRISLRCFDAGVSQQILNRDQIRIGIQKLRRHRMAELMTRDV